MKNEKDTLKPISKDKFVLVHDSKDFSKTKDEKMKTKSTTYAKDAFKRFCKNKSSVVAAIIIGVLMLGSVFIPMISPHDTVATQNLETYLLPPKLFNAGFGWWDGCEEKTGVLAFDSSTGEYVVQGTEFNRPRAIKSELKVYETVYYDYANANFTGGIIRISARDRLTSKSIYYENYTPFAISREDNVKLTVEMDDLDDIESGYKLAPFRINVGFLKNKTDTKPTFVPLTDWSKEYPTEENPMEINLSEYLPEGVDVQQNCRIRFEIEPSADYNAYCWFNKVLITSDNEENEELLNQISIIDPNSTSLLTTKDVGLWRSNGETIVHKAEYSKVSYKYDLYEHNLGLDEKTIGKSKIDEEYKDWCTFDWAYMDSHPNADPNEHFTVLDPDKCPIEMDDDGKYINSFSVVTYNGEKLYQLKCNVQLYKYLGYKEMPRFLFGSDSSGRDVFTHSFRCLKNSLLLSLVCCAVCFTIGLIWGSVSGYYGGTTDLVMERITDILAGVPSTVVLTLMLLLLGRTTTTFALAVCMTGWIGTSSLARTQFYRFKNRESVLAARTLGARDSRLIFKHILPNSLGTIVTSSVLSIPGFIFTEASLSFLHLGLDSGNSFGVILSENQAYLSTFPALILFPTFILCLLMISFNLFGNGLRDALNPTLKGGE